MEKVPDSIWGRDGRLQFLCCALHSVAMLYTPNRLAILHSWMSRDEISHNVKPMKYPSNSVFVLCSRQVVSNGTRVERLSIISILTLFCHKLVGVIK